MSRLNKRKSTVTKTLPILLIPVKPTIVHKVVYHTNVIRPICKLLLDDKHSHKKRMFVGVMIMIFGVIIAKYLGDDSNIIIASVGDGFGYGVHGIGLIPFAEYLAQKFKGE